MIWDGEVMAVLMSITATFWSLCVQSLCLCGCLLLFVMLSDLILYSVGSTHSTAV